MFSQPSVNHNLNLAISHKTNRNNKNHSELREAIFQDSSFA